MDGGGQLQPGDDVPRRGRWPAGDRWRHWRHAATGAGTKPANYAAGDDDPGDDVSFLLAANPGAPLLPLSRVVPPLYVWKVRSRIYRWYGQLRNVEAAVEQAVEKGDAHERQRIYVEQMARLDDIERRVNQLTIPLSFAEELYDLRSHINFVRKRLGWLMQSGATDAVAAG